MTVRAELDERGQALYGTRSLTLDSQPKRHALFGQIGRHIDSEGSWRVVEVPPTFDLGSNQLTSVRWQLAVAGKDQVEVTRFSPSHDGERELLRTEVYEGSDIRDLNVLNSRVSLPGLNPGETVSARVKWERDIPVISGLRKLWREYRRTARLKVASTK